MQSVFDSSIRSRFPSLTSKPVPPSTKSHPIKHLPITSGYRGCPQCNRCYQSEEGFRRHSCASGRSQGSSVMTDCQRFRNNTNSPWFGVFSPPPVPPKPPTLSPWQIFQQQEVQQVEPEGKSGAQVDEYRILHQFLTKERWIQRIKNVSATHEELMAIVRLPARNPFLMSLAGTIVSLLRKTQNQVDNIFLRRLIATRPASEHSVSYQKHHSDVSNPTIDKYAHVIAGVLHLIRQKPQSPYLVPISDKVQQSVDTLLKIVAQSETESFDPATINEQDALVIDEDGDVVDDQDLGARDYIPAQSPVPLTEAEQAMHDVLAALYMATPDTAEQGSFFSPLMHYLLLSSLRPEGGWCSASVITQKIAAMLFVGRLVIGRIVMNDATRYGLTHHQSFQRVATFFHESSEAPMPTLYLLLRGLSSLRSAEQSTVLFNSPSHDPNLVTINGESLEISRIQPVIQELEIDVQRRIDNLIFSESEFSIPENKDIFDEPRNTKPGYSFVDDPRNPWSNRRTLMQYILETPSVFGRFGYISESKIIWYPGAISEYMKDAYELQNLLIVAVILTYGEPARATEIASNLLRNFPGGSIRNVFVTFGTFFLRGSFNKTSFFSGKDRVMCRAPLPSISRLFMRFLVFIRPLYSAFQLILRPHMHDNSVYFLFCGLNRPLTSVDISRTLHSFTLEKLGVGLSCSLHRQLMAFITSRYRALFESHSISTGTEEQLGHSAEMDRQHYGLDASLPGQMDYNTVKTCLEISGVFHYIFGLGLELYSSIHAHRPRLRQMMKELHDVKYPAGGEVQATAIKANTPAPCDQAAAQIAYHLTPFLSQTIENKVNQSHAAVVHLFSPDAISQQTTYLSPEVVVQTEPRVLAKFREFMGDDQQLMGFMNVQQAQAAQLMVDGKRSFALVTPTGSGKTMPGLLASKSFDRGRTTVWILPLLAMHEQYLTRCRRYKLTCDTWHPSTTIPNTPQTLLVTIEATESERFHQFLLQLNQEGRLARVILDEAHLILTHDDFRPVMSTLCWLGEQAIQLVLLTATLPPALHTKLFQAVGLTGPLLLRLPTPRPNISFRVVRVPAKEDLEPYVVNVYQQAQVEGDKILIFCSSRHLVESYSQMLGVPGLHAQYSSAEIHDTIARFRAGEVRTIVATCILGVGLDVPAVTHVIHAGLPYDVISFAQEVGRLGRDKNTRKAWSVVVDHPNQFRKESQEDLYGRKLMMEWFRDDRTCRRIALQTFLDGHAAPCAMLGPDVHLCDNCEKKSKETFEDIVPPPNSPQPRLLPSLPRPPPSHIPKATPSAPTHLQISSHHAQARNAVARLKAHSDEYRTIKRLADHFSHRCIACVARSLQSDHLFSQCRNGPSPTTEGETWAQWVSCLQFSQNHCFFCGLPQIQYTDYNLQDVWLHPYLDKSEKSCEYQHSFLPLAFISYYDPKVLAAVQKYLRRNISHDDKTNPFHKWLVQERDLPNLVRLVLELSKQGLLRF